MSQFSLDEMTPVTVTSVNVRSELHGSDHIPAVDIAVKLKTSNLILSELDGHLRSMLYRKADGQDEAQQQQPGLEGVEAASDLPVLRTMAMEMPLRLKNEYAGYTLVVDRGLGAKSNITLSDCEVNKFKADCMEGGTVELSFRIQASRLEADAIGKIGTLIGNEVSITLEAPAEGQQSLTGAGE